MPRVLLIGQAPGPNTRADCPLYPLPTTSAGGRLAKMLNMSVRDYLRSFDRVNVLHQFPGKEGKEDKFPPHLARAAAEAMLPLLAGRQVVLIGRNVATAFGWGHLDWFTWASQPLGQGRDHIELSVIPHPSGRCRVYNDEAYRERSKEFLRELVCRKVVGGSCLLRQAVRSLDQPATLAA